MSCAVFSQPGVDGNDETSEIHHTNLLLDDEIHGSVSEKRNKVLIFLDTTLSEGRCKQAASIVNCKINFCKIVLMLSFPLFLWRKCEFRHDSRLSRCSPQSRSFRPLFPVQVLRSGERTPEKHPSRSSQKKSIELCVTGHKTCSQRLKTQITATKAVVRSKTQNTQ